MLHTPLVTLLLVTLVTRLFFFFSFASFLVDHSHHFFPHPYFLQGHMHIRDGSHCAQRGPFFHGIGPPGTNCPRPRPQPGGAKQKKWVGVTRVQIRILFMPPCTFGMVPKVRTGAPLSVTSMTWYRTSWNQLSKPPPPTPSATRVFSTRGQINFYETCSLRVRAAK